MSDFARQQSEFQRGILTGDDSVLVEILDGPRERRDALFGVYRHAYGSRLMEAVRNDHELLLSISATRCSMRWDMPMLRQIPRSIRICAGFREPSRRF